MIRETWVKIQQWNLAYMLTYMYARHMWYMGNIHYQLFFKRIFSTWKKSVPETKKTGFLTKGDFEMSIAKKFLMTGWQYLYHSMVPWVYMSKKTIFQKFSWNLMKICSSKKVYKNVPHTKKNPSFFSNLRFKDFF